MATIGSFVFCKEEGVTSWKNGSNAGNNFDEIKR